MAILRLPREILDQILRELLYHDEPLWTGATLLSQKNFKFHLAIMRTSRALREASHQVLYGQNTVQARANLSNSAKTVILSTRWCVDDEPKSLQDQPWRRFRRVKVDIVCEMRVQDNIEGRRIHEILCSFNKILSIDELEMFINFDKGIGTDYEEKVSDILAPLAQLRNLKAISFKGYAWGNETDLSALMTSKDMDLSIKPGELWWLINSMAVFDCKVKQCTIHTSSTTLRQIRGRNGSTRYRQRDREILHDISHHVRHQLGSNRISRERIKSILAKWSEHIAEQEVKPKSPVYKAFQNLMGQNLKGAKEAKEKIAKQVYQTTLCIAMLLIKQEDAEKNFDDLWGL